MKVCALLSVLLAHLPESSGLVLRDGTSVPSAGEADVSHSQQNHAAGDAHLEDVELIGKQQQVLKEKDERIQELERRLAELERDAEVKRDAEEKKGHFSLDSSKSQGNGLFAEVQVAAFPFERNFNGKAPKEFYLEVGTNSRNVLQDSAIMTSAFRRGAFLISFEPLMDKYAQLLTRLGGGIPDHRRQLGLQHEHGLVLPFAVGCSGSTAFHVAQVDGCSSVLPMRGSAFAADPKAAMWDKNKESWVKKDCARELEERQVPCVSLERVIGDWLGGKDIAHIKIDAQGFDLNVVKSAGAQLEKLKSVHMEVQCDSAAMIYEGQPNCTSVFSEMTRLGFESTFDPAECKTCVETDIDFKRAA